MFLKAVKTEPKMLITCIQNTLFANIVLCTKFTILLNTYLTEF